MSIHLNLDICPFCKTDHHLLLFHDGIECQYCKVSIFIRDNIIVGLYYDSSDKETISLIYDVPETILHFNGNDIIIKDVIYFASLEDLKNKMKLYSVYS